MGDTFYHPDADEDDASTRCRVSLQGEVAFERHRRETAEARLKETLAKLGILYSQARRLVQETQKKSPWIAKVAVTLQDNIANLSKGKIVVEDYPRTPKSGMDTHRSQEHFDFRPLEKAKVEIDALRSSEGSLKRRLEDLSKTFSEDRTTTNVDLAVKDAEIARLQAQVDRHENQMQALKDQLSAELALHQDTYENLLRENGRFVRENEKTVSEVEKLRADLQNAAAFCEERERIRLNMVEERSQLVEELAEMSHIVEMNKWYCTVQELQNGRADRGPYDVLDDCIRMESETETIESRMESDTTRGPESLVWKQRELLIGFIRKSLVDRDQLLISEDNLKRKAISLHYLQQRVEEMSIEINHRRTQTDEVNAQVYELQELLEEKKRHCATIGTQTSVLPLQRSASQSQTVTPRHALTRGSKVRAISSDQMNSVDERRLSGGKMKIQPKPYPISLSASTTMRKNPRFI